MLRSHFKYYFSLISAVLPHKRWRNILKNQLSYFLSYFKIVTRWNVMPLFVSLEPTNVCNLRCPECPVGMRTKLVKPISMDMQLTGKLIDELAPTLTHLILYFQGEPLLSNNFLKMVKYAHSKNILTSTSTNAQLISDNMAKQLVQSGLARLIISIDGTTQETYESYRVGGKLDKALEAVKNLVKWKKALKSASPFLEIQFLVLKTNEHQMVAMQRLAKGLKADKLTFKTAQLYNYETGHPLLPVNQKYRRYELRNDGKYHIKSPLFNRCKRLWMGSVINSRGDVLPCCFDKDSSYIFGNLHKDTFENCYKSQVAYRFRQSIVSDRKQFAMCCNCTTP